MWTVSVPTAAAAGLSLSVAGDGSASFAITFTANTLFSFVMAGN